jgi:hypothetical protein
VKAVFLAFAAAAVLLAGCSDDKPGGTETQPQAEAILHKDCGNPKWREENLGLWYSVCRKPMNW